MFFCFPNPKTREQRLLEGADWKAGTEAREGADEGIKPGGITG